MQAVALQGTYFDSFIHHRIRRWWLVWIFLALTISSFLCSFSFASLVHQVMENLFSTQHVLPLIALTHGVIKSKFFQWDIMLAESFTTWGVFIPQITLDTLLCTLSSFSTFLKQVNNAKNAMIISSCGDQQTGNCKVCTTSLRWHQGLITPFLLQNCQLHPQLAQSQPGCFHCGTPSYAWCYRVAWLG